MWRYVIKNVVRSVNFATMVETNAAEVASVKHTFGNILNLSDTPARDGKALQFCRKYMQLDDEEREDIINFIANQQTIRMEVAKRNALAFASISDSNPELLMRAAERLKQSLNPPYHEAFGAISKLDCGVKFLVDLRSNVLNMLQKLDSKDSTYHSVKLLNYYLTTTLAFAFSIGFLSLDRITWDSSCDMLQKISEYEAVHKIRNWTDLKQRVGPYRRCYVFTHSSMPKEPIVVLHTALTEDISSAIGSIVKHKGSPYGHRQSCPDQSARSTKMEENPFKIQAAIFYSITSTQRGLHGIELGNKLIKKVVGEVLKEFPHITKLSSLSPIPGFRDWLLIEINKAKEGVSIVPNLISRDELLNFGDILGVSESSNIWNVMGQILASNQWVNDGNVRDALKIPLLKLCAHYLYREKRRSYALNSVAHFHLRNGAVMWRLNWEADLSPRGLNNSCGIMVNYRYFMEETEMNSEKYVEDYVIKISEDVKSFLPSSINKL